MKAKSTLLPLLAIAGSSLLVISSASAQATSNTWDTDAAGNWTDTLNWLGDAAYAEGADNTATLGNFITANCIITLNAPITIGNITASDTTHNYTISGTNTLTLDRTSGTPTIDVTSGRTLTISSNIDGSDGLAKSGAGNLVLSGDNTYTGVTTFGPTTGILTIAHNNALGSTAAGSHTTFTTNASVNRYITVNSGITTPENITLTGTGEGGYDSPLGAGGSGASQGTYSGTITLAMNRGIRIGPANWTGTITGTITQIDTAPPKLLFTGSNTVSNPITINGADLWIIKGTTTLNAVNGSGIGSTTLYDNGVLKLGVTDAIRTDRDFTLDSVNTNRLDLNGNNQTIRGLITKAGTNTREVINNVSSTTSTLTVGNGGGDYSFGGVIRNNTTGTGIVALTKIGSGTQTLTGTNTYTGATTITEGTLKLGANDVLPNGSAVSLGTATLDADTRTDTLGTLNVTGNAVINLGSGAALAFADSSAGGTGTWAGTLNITGTLGATSLKFGTSSSGLSTAQLAKISVNGGGLGTYTLDASGYLVPGGPDIIAPTLVSITDDKSGGPVTVNTLVTYTVTFSEDIATTLTTSDFNNEGTAPLAINSVAETAPTSGVFTVVATPTGTGTLKLRIPTGTLVEDTSGNDLVVPVSDTTIITVNPSDPYLAWAGPGVLFDADANGDGVDNGLAFLLGATGPGVSALNKLPVPEEVSGGLKLTFQMLDDTANGNATLAIEYSNSLAVGSWTAVQVPYSGGTVDDIGFNITGTGPLNVTATIPLSKAGGTGKLFGRLKAVNP